MLPPPSPLVPLLAMASLALATGPAFPGAGTAPPKVKPSQADNFTWTNPFTSWKMDKFDTACQSTRTFEALELQIHDLQSPEPLGLLPYADGLKSFFAGRPYPGGWDGLDAHGYERTLLKMDYRSVPRPVRIWILQEECDRGPGMGLFAVFAEPAPGDVGDRTAQRALLNLCEVEDLNQIDKWDTERTVIFAPGALYEALPVWLASTRSRCEATLADLDLYSPDIKDGGVIGYATSHSVPDRRQGLRKIEFTLEARVMAARTAGDEEQAAAPGEEEEVPEGSQGTAATKQGPADDEDRKDEL